MTHSIALESLNPANQTSRTMSNRYVVMDTRKVVETILENVDASGNPVFEIRSIETKRGRKTKSLAGRGVHLVRIRTIKSYKLNNDDVHPEIVIKNSYDGSSALECYVGIFRLVCTNGLVIPVKNSEFGRIKIRHTGTSEQAAFDIVSGFTAHLRETVEVQRKLAVTNLTEEQAIDFAMKASKLRWDGAFSVEDTEKLLEVARPEDKGSNLWVILNRVQEKLINGGIKASDMKKTSRAITNVQKNIEINTKLYDLAYEYCN